MNIAVRYPLDRLIECAQCGSPMQLQEEQHARYVCPGSLDRNEPCSVPTLPART